MELSNDELGSRSIRTRSIPNVESQRLHARLDYLRVNRFALLHGADQKGDVRTFARQVVNIERELTRRNEPFVLVSDGRHLEIDVHAVRLIKPPPSWAERRARPL